MIMAIIAQFCYEEMEVWKEPTVGISMQGWFPIYLLSQ